MQRLTEEQEKMLAEANKKRSDEKILSLIGLAMRAGKLSIGTDRICDEVRRHGVPNEAEVMGRKIRSVGIVLIASDASDNTKKRLINTCSYYGIRFVETGIAADAIADKLGRNTSCAACATFDRGFSDGLRKTIEQINVISNKF